ncbi:uncharacterized protein LOC144071231 [Stigmatopora argus]
MAAILFVQLIWLAFLLSDCCCLYSPSNIKEHALSRYPAVLEEKTMTQEQNSVVPKHNMEKHGVQILAPPVNEDSSESPPRPSDQHPFNLLVEEHAKDIGVEGISFPGVGDLKRFVETLKNSFLTPGKDVAHFQTAREVMRNEIAGAEKQNLNDDYGKLQIEESTYGQNAKEVGNPASSPSISMPRPRPRTLKTTDPHQTDPSKTKTAGDWRKNNHLLDQNQFPSNTIDGQVPLSPTRMEPPNGSGMASGRSRIKSHKKPPFHVNVKPSQHGPYKKRVYVPRDPIASWVYMPEGGSKQRVQISPAKDSHDGSFEVQNPLLDGRNHYYANPKMSTSQLRGQQTKFPQTNDIYNPISTFRRGFPVHAGLKKSKHETRYGFQSRSGYARRNKAFSRSQFTPRKRALSRRQWPKKLWRPSLATE